MEMEGQIRKKSSVAPTTRSPCLCHVSSHQNLPLEREVVPRRLLAIRPEPVEVARGLLLHDVAAALGRQTEAHDRRRARVLEITELVHLGERAREARTVPPVVGDDRERAAGREQRRAAAQKGCVEQVRPVRVALPARPLGWLRMVDANVVDRARPQP